MDYVVIVLEEGCTKAQTSGMRLDHAKRVTEEGQGWE